MAAGVESKDATLQKNTLACVWACLGWQVGFQKGESACLAKISKLHSRPGSVFETGEGLKMLAILNKLASLKATLDGNYDRHSD